MPEWCRELRLLQRLDWKIIDEQVNDRMVPRAQITTTIGLKNNWWADKCQNGAESSEITRLLQGLDWKIIKEQINARMVLRAQTLSDYYKDWIEK